jgi:predicted outer membrane repeat protein
MASALALALPVSASLDAAPASAAVRPHIPAVHTYVVNSHGDGNASSPSSGHCRTTLGSCTLRAAIEVADALRVPAVVKLTAGMYSLSLGTLDVTDPKGVTIDGRSSGATSIAGTGIDRDFFVSESVDLSGPSTQGAGLVLNNLAVTNGVALPTSLNSNHGGGVLVDDVNDSLTATNVRFQNDQAGNATTNSGEGGAVYNQGLSTLTNCSFIGNRATEYGGAVYQRNMSLTIVHSTFTGNHAAPLLADAGAYGGAVYTGAPTQISNSTFTGNRATAIGSGDAGGGGLYAGEATTLTADTFVGNAALGTPGTGTGYGGGLYNDYSVGDMVGLSFKDNTAQGENAYGGALYNYSNAGLVGASFLGNRAVGSASGAGGAIYNYLEYTFLSVNHSLFKANYATSSATSSSSQGGGAIYDTAGARISSSTFVGNVAQNGDGGALWNHGDGDSIYGSTFTGNVATGGTHGADGNAGYGGALYLWDTSNVSGAIVVGNHASQGGGGLFSDDGNNVSDTLIKSNTANEGGGVYLEWLISGTRNVIIDNSAVGASAAGGGVFIDGGSQNGVILTGSVIAGNVAVLGAGVEIGIPGASAGGAGALSGSYVGGNHTPSGASSECHYGTAPSPIGSGVFGNVAGNTSCFLVGANDRQGAAQQGYWFATPAGHVVAKQGATYAAAGPTAAIAAGPGNAGYFTVAPNGTVKGFGTAAAHGSAVGRLAGGKAVALITTLDREGYWVVSSTGAVAAFGDAVNYGGHLGVHIVAAAATVDAKGYWLVTSTGVVLTFGDAKNLGHHAGAVRIAATPDGQGYWLVTATGTVHPYGDAKLYGSVATAGVIGIAASPDGRGYLIFTKSGKVIPKGDAHSSGAVAGGFAAVTAS